MNTRGCGQAIVGTLVNPGSAGCRPQTGLSRLPRNNLSRLPGSNIAGSLPVDDMDQAPVRWAR
jgi:hypothetical protein